MSVHSKRLGVVGTLGLGVNSIYTVPAGYRTIVKELLFQNNSGAANRIIFTVTTAGGISVSFGVTVGASASATESLKYDCWIVLHEGDILKVQAITNGAAEVYASGTELAL